MGEGTSRLGWFLLVAMGIGAIVGAWTMILEPSWLRKEVTPPRQTPPGRPAKLEVQQSTMPDANSVVDRTVRESIANAPQDAVTAAIRIIVVDGAGTALPGARVLVTDRQIFSPMESSEAEAEIADAHVIIDGVSGGNTSTEFLGRFGEEYFVRVGSVGTGVVCGPSSIRPQPQGPKEYRYRVEQLLAAAMQLGDLSTPVNVSWHIASTFAPGLEPDTIKVARRTLSEALQLPIEQVTVFAPKDENIEPHCKVSVYHQTRGWFHSQVRVLPLESVRIPSIVSVPDFGVRPPVRVTVICLDSSGTEWPVKVSLLGGEGDGFPRFGTTFKSGVPQPFPPGRMTLGFVDPLLAATCSKDITVESDQIVRVNLPMIPRDVSLRFVKDGKVFRGPVVLDVKFPSIGRSYRVRSRGNATGMTRIAISHTSECSVTVRAGTVRKECVIPAGWADSQFLVVL